MEHDPQPDAADEYARLHRLFEAARLLGPGEREAFLENLGPEDAGLTEELRELLSLEGATAGFGEEEIEGTRRALEELTADRSGVEPWMPESIGPYRIQRQLGAGGMGVVYEAQQVDPRRRVALKVVHPMLATEERIRRLRKEAEVLGRLQHPSITQIFAAGEADLGNGPQPYIAMEFVEGQDLLSYAENRRLDRRERVELVAKVADAVHHANERGVVHRDLKPDNVMVTPEGLPKVLDFGIARARGTSTALSTLVTREGQVLGTLAYMAPEQLGRGDHEITQRADVYALGVITFEILAGRLPVDVTNLSLPAAVQAIQLEEPPLLGRRDPRLQGDLETIVGKALEKEPGRRYPSAGSFAEDLRRYLDDVPVRARPPSRVYLVRKFVRRHRTLVGGFAATLVSLLLGTAFSVFYGLRASNRADELATSQEETLSAKEELRGTLYHTEMLLAAQVSELPGGARQLETLVEHWVPTGDEEDLRGWEWSYFKARSAPRFGVCETGRGLVARLAYHPTRPWLLEGGSYGWSVREVTSGETLTEGRVEAGFCMGAAWSPDGSRLAYTEFYPADDTGRVVVLGVDDWGVLEERGFDLPTGGLAWNPNGDQLACLTFHGQLFVLGRDLSTLKELEGVMATPEGFSFDGTGGRFAAFSYGEACLYETTDWSLQRRWRLYGSSMMNGLSWDPAGKLLATFSHEGDLAVSRVATGELLARRTVNLGGNVVRWSPDGSRVATVGRDQALRLWDPESLEELDVFHGHAQPPRDLAWSPDARRIATAGEGGVLHLWDLEAPAPTRELQTLRSGTADRARLAWNPAGTRLAARLGDKCEVWDEAGNPIAVSEVDPEWSHDGRYLLGYMDDDLWRLEVESGEVEYFVGFGARTGPVSTHPTQPWALLVADRRLRRFDFASGSMEEWLEYPSYVTSPSWSADGSRLAFLVDRGIVVLDTRDSSPVAEWAGAEAKRASLAPEGVTCAVATVDGGILIVDLEGDEPPRVLEGHSLEVSALAWHPEEPRLASVSLDGILKIWDTDRAALCTSFRSETPLLAVAWSPDGQALATLSLSGLVKIRDTDP